MGGVLSGESVVIHDGEMIEEYRNAPFSEVKECREDFKAMNESSHMTLNEEEFDETFGMFLGDTEMHFQLFDTKNRGIVDASEVFAGMYLYSKIHAVNAMHQRLLAIFELFDADNSGTLEEQELTMLFMASSRGMCKLAGLPVPSLGSLELMSRRAFKDMDKDHSGTISTAELSDWLMAQEDVAGYVSRFVGARSITLTKMVFRSRMEELEAAVMARGVQDGEVPLDVVRGFILKEVLQAHNKSVPESEADAIFEAFKDVLDEDDEGERDSATPPHVFIAAMRPLVAFEVSDENNNGQLDSNEDLKFLLWLVNDKEPEPEAVSAALEIIDEDRSGKIGRPEWVSYCAQRDATAGLLRFRADMELLWKQADKDKSGVLTRGEVEGVIQASLGYLVRDPLLTPTEKLSVQTALDALTTDMLSKLDESGNGRVDWLEFLEGMRVFHPIVTEFKNFVLTMTKNHKKEKN